jgi:hypothetical protein
MMTGPAPAFVLLRADGVRVVAFVREQKLRGPGKSLADDSYCANPAVWSKWGSQSLGGPLVLPSECSQQRCRSA